MSRIVINPEHLAEAAGVLATTAGEYQAIGTRAAACDCGCMPPDVAAVTESVTASVSSGLNALATDLAGEAQDLGFRADVPQEGGVALVIAGDTYAPAAANGGGVNLVITSDVYAPALTSGPGAGLVIAGDTYAPTAANGGGTGLVIYGDTPPAMDGGNVLVTATPGQPGFSLVAIREPSPEISMDAFDAYMATSFVTPWSAGPGGFQARGWMGNLVGYWGSSVLAPPSSYRVPGFSVPNP